MLYYKFTVGKLKKRDYVDDHGYIPYHFQTMLLLA